MYYIKIGQINAHSIRFVQLYDDIGYKNTKLVHFFAHNYW